LQPFRAVGCVDARALQGKALIFPGQLAPPAGSRRHSLAAVLTQVAGAPARGVNVPSRVSTAVTAHLLVAGLT
jgi:hypothetical protein